MARAFSWGTCTFFCFPHVDSRFAFVNAPYGVRD
jgi:hypothetical protein